MGGESIDKVNGPASSGVFITSNLGGRPLGESCSCEDWAITAERIALLVPDGPLRTRATDE